MPFFSLEYRQSRKESANWILSLYSRLFQGKFDDFDRYFVSYGLPGEQVYV